MVILVDYGTTHNFIMQKLVDSLKLPLMGMRLVMVIMSTEIAVKEREVVKW